MKYIFMVNSFSLRNETERIKTKVDEIAKAFNLDYEIRVNSDKLSTEDILSEYKKERNIIVGLGGDGTINRIVNAIYGTKNVLSLLPLGTGNDFSHSVVEQMEDGFNKVDLVKINDKYFINLVCFGIDADIANDETFVNSKIIPRSQRYNAGIISNYIHFKGKKMKITINNDIIEKTFATIAVANGKYYGRGFTMGPHARIDDGILDVYLIDNMNKIVLVKLILDLRKGKHESSSKTKYYQTDKLIIETEKPISCNYDGEKMTSNKYNIEIMPKALELFYNKELQEEFAKIKIKK